MFGRGGSGAPPPPRAPGWGRAVALLLATTQVACVGAGSDAAGAFGRGSDPAGSVGRAVDADGRPLAGVAVHDLQPATGERGARLATSATDGVFRLPVGRDAGAPLEPRTVLLTRPGRAGIAVAVQHVHLGDFPMPPGATIAGIVQDAAGKPIAGATVFATDALRLAVLDDRGWWEALWAGMPYAATATGADGRFELRGAPVGGARVRITKAGFATFTSPSLGTAGPIAATLTATGSARGRVVDRSGAPVRAVVTVVDEAGVTRHADSASDGRFEVPLPSSRRYRVEAHLARAVTMPHGPTGAAEWHDGPRTHLTLVPVELRNDVPTVLTTITDAATRLPIAGARAGLFWGRAPPLTEDALARLAPLGAPLPTGTVPFLIQNGAIEGLLIGAADGYATGVAHVPLHTCVGATRAAHVALHRSTTVSGRVVGEDGAPVAGAHVRAWPRQDRHVGDAFGHRQVWMLREVRTDPDGRFTLHHCPQVELVVSATRATPRSSLPGVGPSGFPRGMPAVTVPRRDPPGSVSTSVVLPRSEPGAPVELTLGRAVTVRGRLRSEHPRGCRVLLDLPGHSIARWPSATSGHPLMASSWSAPIAADGTFAMAGVAPGTWSVHVMPPVVQPGVLPRVVAAGSVTVGAMDVELSIDLDPLVPGRVHGTIATPDAAGLAVIAVPDELAEWIWSVRHPQHLATSPHTFPAADGAWSLALPPGVWSIGVIDAVTRELLAAAEPVSVKAGAAATVDLAVRVR